MTGGRRKTGLELSGVTLLESSVALLAQSSSLTKALYLLGALPFGYALIHFVVFCGFHRAAAERLGWYSLAVTVSFLWKSYCDGALARVLFAEAGGGKVRVNWFRAALLTSTWQPWALFVIPAAGLAALPFAWTVSFYRHLSLLSFLDESKPVRSSWRLAQRWTRQEWVLLLLVSLIWLLLTVNLFVLLMLIPQLLQGIAGIETELARLGAGLLTQVSLLIVAFVSWLLVDPLLTAAAVLRTYRAEAERSGVDLKAAIARMGVLILLLVASPCGWSADRSVDPDLLRDEVNQVLAGDEYSWRGEDAPPPVAASWFRAIGKAIDQAMDWLRKVLDQLLPPPEELSPATRNPDSFGGLAAKWWLVAIAGCFAVGLGWAFLRMRSSEPVKAIPAAIESSEKVDVSREDVGPERLPEGEWLALAEELIQQGDFRLATRAMHLAGLRYLAERKLVSLAYWKSGLDYERELQRRSREKPEVPAAFQANLRAFECVWYGRHSGSEEEVRVLAGRIAEMRRRAEG